MTDQQSNELSMSKAVQQVLNTNSVIIESVPAFQSAKSELDNALQVIDQAAQIQAKNITGNAEDKVEAATEAIDAALAIVGPAKSYAKTVGNNTLYQQINYNRSHFRTRHSAILNNLTLIRDTIQANASLLEDYGITADQISDLTELINIYGSLVTAPRSAITSKSVATKTLAASFKELRSVITRLDGFIEAKKKANPDFYNAYKSARVIINNRGKRKQAEPSSEVSVKKAA